MLKLLADENFNGDWLRALQRRCPKVDVMRAQDVGLSGVDDAEILEWCAKQQRTLVTHDVRTMLSIAKERSQAGLAMAGIVAAKPTLSMAEILDDFQMLVACSEPAEMEHNVLFLPLR